MRKRSKNSEQSLDFFNVEMIELPADVLNNNSAAIIANDSFKPSPHYEDHAGTQEIKIKSLNVLNIDEDSRETSCTAIIHYSSSELSAPSIARPSTKEQQESVERQAEILNPEPSDSEIPEKKRLRLKGKEATKKIIYQQQEESSQQNVIEQPGKISQVFRSFVAESFDDLLFSKLPPQCNVTCAISFRHDFFSMTRRYDLFLVREKKHILSSIKKRCRLESQFEFITNNNNSKQMVGYLKSNFTGMEYVTKRVHKDNHISELCWIGFDFNMLGTTPERNFTVIKNMKAKLQNIPHFSQIKNYYENGLTENFEMLSNKRAIQNSEGEYELDFHGKISHPSSNNFILINSKSKEAMLFGKRTENTYFLEIGHPFSIFEGFAIAVASLDYKICVR